MLTAIVVLLSLNLFSTLLVVGALGNSQKALAQIEMNTRGYGK